MLVRESAAPEPKTATVERREASVLRRTQGASPAPGLPRHVQAQRVPRKHPYDSRRSAHPFRGCVKRKSKTRAQKTRRGNEIGCLKSEKRRTAHPHPEERARSRSPQSRTRGARVSRDEDDTKLARPHASRRIAAL